MNRLISIHRMLGIVERSAAVCLMGMLVTASAFNILARNLLGRSYGWLQVAEPTLVLWIALVGATLALGQQRHIRLELLLKFCPDAWCRNARRCVAAVGVCIMGLLTVTAAQFAVSEIALFGLPGWPAVAFPLFFLVSSCRYLLWVLIPDDLLSEVRP